MESSNIASSSRAAEEIAKTAKAAFEASQLISSSERVAALREIRQELEAAKEDILAANRKDLKVHTATLRCLARLIAPLSRTYIAYFNPSPLVPL